MKVRLMNVAATLTAVVLAALGASPVRADLPLNRKVLDFADSNVGNQVGRGECWDLADQALAYAGAKRPNIDYPGQTYVFGRPVGLDQVQPGDILQIDDVTFPGLWTIHHHTAVVHDVSGTKVRFIEQNFNNVRRVVQTDAWYDLGARRGGTLTIFRPEGAAAAADGRTRWDYRGGSFEAVGGGWRESQPGGYARDYREVGRTADYVEVLSTDADAIRFRLYVDHCDRAMQGGGGWRYGTPGQWE